MLDTAPTLETQLLERIQRLEEEMQALRMSTLAERRFVLDGERHAYHVARGNRTWDNERAVEIPVVWDRLRRCGDSGGDGDSDGNGGGRTGTEGGEGRAPAGAGVGGGGARAGGVIEVGNVLGHYFEIDHPVLDRDERHRTVTWNEDVLSFEPPFAPELVLSISTLEHVGHGAQPRDPTGFARAIEAIRSWLAPGGRLLFTVPLGYNPAVRDYLDGLPNRAAPVSLRCMRRTTIDNLWVQVDYAEVRDCRYNRPFPCANAIAIVELGP